MENAYTGWLSPTGEFIKANVYDQYYKACDIVEKCQYYKRGQADTTLLELRWVQISKFDKYRIHFYHHLTDYQKIWIDDKLENVNDFILDEESLKFLEVECK